MSTTLSKGYKLPSAGDDSTTWMSNIEDNIQRLNDHDHDGTDSALIDGSKISKATAIEISDSDGSWVDGGSSTYNRYSYVLSSSVGPIPANFMVSGTPSAELCDVKIMDSSNNYEQVFVKYVWANTGSSTTLTIYTPEKFSMSILFI